MAQGLRIVTADNDHGPVCRRSEKRARVLLAATLQNATGSWQVRLRNISSAGALIESPIVPPPGSFVLFTRGPIAVTARVVWTEGTRLGLAFRDRIDEHELLIVIGAPPPPTKSLKPLFPSATAGHA